MGGATRLITFLSIPLPPVRSSILRCRRCISSFLPAYPLAFGVRAKPQFRTARLVKSFHSQFSSNSSGFESTAVQQHQQQQQQSSHPWPEWTNFIHVLSNWEELSAPEDNWILPEDAFVAYEQLSDEFVRAATSCLGFARARPNLIGLLSRKDIEAVVSNGTPFLFRSALDTSRRLRAFIKSDGSSVVQVDQANTVDVMKYILSYASNPSVTSERSGLYSRELVDTSIRNLLHELSVLSCRTPTGHEPAAQHHQVTGGQGVSDPIRQDIVMKRGDWICTKCKFMNFARNVKCLECEEPRPKKQLTGGEWECPQCSFFNYGRNSVCLRCDCRRPGPPIFNATNNFPGIIPQHRRNQTSELNYGSNTQLNSHSRSFQFPDKVSATDIDAQKNEKEQGQNPEPEPEPRKWFKRMMELHEPKAETRTNPDNDSPSPSTPKREHVVQARNSQDRPQTSPQAINTKSVPFVPFPPGYFARKDTEQPNVPESPQSNPSPSDTSPDTNTRAVEHKENENQTQNRAGSSSVRWTGPSLEGSGVTEPDPLDMSEEAKAERWFKRVAQIKDISELSQIPDEDFPSIMPMRKGVNRFVVSKRKKPLERRLTSQEYRRSLPNVTNDPVNNEGGNA